MRMTIWDTNTNEKCEVELPSTISTADQMVLGTGTKRYVLTETAPSTKKQVWPLEQHATEEANVSPKHECLAADCENEELTQIGRILDKYMTIYHYSSARLVPSVELNLIRVLIKAGFAELVIIEDALLAPFTMAYADVNKHKAMRRLLTVTRADAKDHKDLIGEYWDIVHSQLEQIQEDTTCDQYVGAFRCINPNVHLLKLEHALSVLKIVYKNIKQDYDAKCVFTYLCYAITMSHNASRFIDAYNRTRADLLLSHMRLRMAISVCNDATVIASLIAASDRLLGVTRFPKMNKRNTPMEIAVGFLWLCHHTDDTPPSYPSSLEYEVPTIALTELDPIQL